MIEQKTHTTLEELGVATGRKHSMVAKQAKKENWPFEVEPGSARRRWYPIASLPRVIARQLQAKKAILAMKIISEAKKETMPDAFLAVLDAEVYEIRRMRT